MGFPLELLVEMDSQVLRHASAIEDFTVDCIVCLNNTTLVGDANACGLVRIKLHGPLGFKHVKNFIGKKA